jgi:hypothetical protein
VVREVWRAFMKILEVAFAAGFGIGLGFMMGWQLKVQESPAADIARITHTNANAIVSIQEAQKKQEIFNKTNATMLHVMRLYIDACCK